jgi:diacylglycerol O-acyltransferase
MELLSTLLDAEPGGRKIPSPPQRHVEREPEAWELLARSYTSLVTQPARATRLQLEAMRALGEFLAGRARDSWNPLDPLRAWWSPDEAGSTSLGAAPRTMFNRAITPHRRVAFRAVSLGELRRIKNAAGTTLNDVVMAICAGGLRRYLERHAALPEQALVAGVPVSVRTGAESETYSNQVSMIFATLATDEADPRKRLERIHDAMQNAKEMQQAIPAQLLQDFSQFTPPALAAQAARVVAGLRLADRVALPCNVVISNVPGPRHALYLAGAELRAFIPVSTVGDGMALNITVVSYRDRMDFGLVACREVVPDLWDLLDDLDRAMEELGTAY